MAKINDTVVAPCTGNQPSQLLGLALGFANFDQELWWLNTAPLLGNLLSQANYDIHKQYQYLAFYHKHILPMLGPYTAPGLEPRWMGYFNSDGHPFETSLNFQDSKITVRLAFEPLSPLAGTDRDPLNQFMAREFLGQLARSQPCVDLQWFNHFDSELGLSLEQARLIASKVPKLGKTQRGVGIDLRDHGIVPKAYFYPEHKARMMGVPIAGLVFKAIRKLEESKSFTLALDTLEKFLAPCFKTRADGYYKNPTEVFAVSIDCLVPSKSRIKLYVGETQATLARVRELWTLGGLLADQATLTGLSLIEAIWDILDMGDSKTQQMDFNYLPLGFYYELQQGTEYPKPQLYIPLHEKNDDTIANRLTKVFEYLKWNDIAVRYKEQLMANLNLKETTSIQRWVSFSYLENKGVYMSLYFQSVGGFTENM
ncbi:tryptophan dimethylallyltransferase [Nannizzia gypsea CBS 118893]|uniref:Tryptophan dimethylallyltransferase n=1 Tax=Arthroderma gypseum (strain ATCC MYA-4604 / CBS 118893) TaxID=535722 RepID=E5R2D3_ARTGP|nr:tryptophan dimethylallyltransferase [Nannizzia gypsea CBS 118893]EFQ97023.1 tryptophan dimethylallyltransferase [Nannizzia gypsea CBS 118893]